VIIRSGLIDIECVLDDRFPTAKDNQTGAEKGHVMSKGGSHGGGKGSGGKSSSGGKGNGGNWPSTTGNPSGGGRGNAPPSRPSK